MQKDGGAAAHRRPSSLNQRVQGSSPCRPTHKLGCFGDIQSTIPRRVVEDQAVQDFTIAELAALARFYATPAGRSSRAQVRRVLGRGHAGTNSRGRRVGPDSRRTHRTASLSG
jgi:hypothetical protein